ncbi:MAG: S1 RNA-binding domain-containing protein [Peptococcaceae bacterium]|jgi:hypothetical protein|nr:S1 RNA-binding domain-containing protein [Peptococcaceae bacterium]
MTVKKKTDALDLMLAAEWNQEFPMAEEDQTLSAEENSENIESLNSAGQQPETSDVDMNDLLGSMDERPEDRYLEDGDHQNETDESIDPDPFGFDADDSDFKNSDGDKPDEPPPEKPKRTSRKKKEPEPAADLSGSGPGDDADGGFDNDGAADDPGDDAGDDPDDAGDGLSDGATGNSDDGAEGGLDDDAPDLSFEDTPTARPAKRPVRKRAAPPPILTIESKTEVETRESIEDAAWHEIRNAYRTRKMLTGALGGIERTETGKTVAIVNYNDFRIVIPMKEMMINLTRNPSGPEYDDLMLRQNKILGNMLGAEIDFIVKGIESKSRSIVASRKDAMLKKRQLFYLNTDANRMYRIYDGRVVQARVIAVADKVVRVEAFGVECSIMARDLSWDWIGDAHERFNVGDQILVRVLSVRRNSLEDITIKADIKSVSDNTSHENLKKCRVQSKYAGKVTDVHKGVVYIRLANGANAIAHSCYDRRMPGKKDDVSFAVTHIDEERGVAVGLITRIIKQNL